MEGVKSQPPREAACRAASGSISQSEVRAYFDSVAPRWNELRQEYFPEEVRAEVIRRLAPHPDMRVADIGSGTGFLAAGLAPLVAEVHCIDSSPAMLEQAREGLKDFSNVRYNLSDGQSLPLAEGSFDAVVANMFLHHAPDPASALSEMARILRTGGRLVLTDLDEHSEEWMRAEMADVWLGFKRDQVREWLVAAGLESIGLYCCGQDCCAEGPGGGQAEISIFVA